MSRARGGACQWAQDVLKHQGLKSVTWTSSLCSLDKRGGRWAASVRGYCVKTKRRDVMGQDVYQESRPRGGMWWAKSCIKNQDQEAGHRLSSSRRQGRGPNILKSFPASVWDIVKKKRLQGWTSNSIPASKRESVHGARCFKDDGRGMSCIKSSLLLQVLQAQEPIKAKNLVASVSCSLTTSKTSASTIEMLYCCLLLDIKPLGFFLFLLHCRPRFPTFDSKRKEKIADATIKKIQKIKIADATKR